MRSLTELLSGAVEEMLYGRPVRSVPAIKVHTEVCRVLAQEVGLRESDLEHLASLLSVTFLGLPPDFDPREALRRCSRDSLERLEYVMDERGDGSDGAFLFIQLRRAEHKGLHVEGRPWEFVRLNRYLGEARFYLKERMRSGDPLVVAGGSFGEPNLEDFVEDLVMEVAGSSTGMTEFRGTTLPGFEEADLRMALSRRGLFLYDERRPVVLGSKMSERFFVVERRV